MELFDTIIKNCLLEDAPNGDLTTIATVDENTIIRGKFIAKADGVICGLNIVRRTFELCGGDFLLNFCVSEGDLVKKGDVLAEINGNAHTILLGERTALNLMQRASGIATMTREAVLKINGTTSKICDTRKTMPNLRVLDKYAVRVGGGTNHRFCLSDGILIKDNHIKAAGGITNAVT
ncbi:MAG: carboxylating nicotinate-nucleotide diphosphorylase, partial [Clostridia bacterium]